MLLKSQGRQTFLTTCLYKTERFKLNLWQRYGSVLAIVPDKALWFAVLMHTLPQWLNTLLWVSLLVLYRLVLVLVVPVIRLTEHHTPAMLSKKQVEQWTKERYQPDHC